MTTILGPKGLPIAEANAELSWDDVHRARAGAKHLPGEHDQLDHGRRGGSGQFAETQDMTGIIEPNASRLQDFSPGELETWTTIMDEYGVSITELADTMAGFVGQEEIDHAKSWYPNVGQLSTDLATETKISKDRIAAAFGVCSPKCKWKTKNGEGEERYVSEMARFIARGGAKDKNGRDLPPEQAFKKWKAEYEKNNTTLTAGEGKPAKAQLMNRNGAKGMAVMMGKLEVEDVLGNNKTRSFFDNIMDPGGTHEVTIDTHMEKVLEMVYGVSSNDANAFVTKTGGTVKKGNRVLGAGYVAVAEAVRMIAQRYDVSADVAQAAFWEQVQDQPHISWDNGKVWPTGKEKVPKPKPKKSWEP